MGSESRNPRSPCFSGTPDLLLNKNRAHGTCSFDEGLVRASLNLPHSLSAGAPPACLSTRPGAALFLGAAPWEASCRPCGGGSGRGSSVFPPLLLFSSNDLERRSPVLRHRSVNPARAGGAGGWTAAGTELFQRHSAPPLGPATRVYSPVPAFPIEQMAFIKKHDHEFRPSQLTH